jgi:rhamnosyltransferase
MGKMKISVVLPTINFSAGLAKAVEGLKRQTVPVHEIIVIDSSSDDGTADLARSFGLKVLTVPRAAFDHGGTRAMAAREAEGEIIVFFTQDALLEDPQALARLVAPFEAGERTGCAFGRQLPRPDADVFGRALRSFNYPAASYKRGFSDKSVYGLKTAFVSNSFAAYSRRALQEIGWFKERLILGEDTYAGARLLMAGYSIAYAADAVVTHSHNYTAWQELERYFDIGVFHREERWILDNFGGAEGEGFKFVRFGLKFLKENGAVLRVPEFFLRTGLKYIGYKAGYFYKLMPRGLARNMSMHRSWWG